MSVTGLVRAVRGVRADYVDIALALVFSVVGVLEPPLHTVDGFDAGPAWLASVIGVFMGVPLVLRRRAPAVCLLVMCGALALPALVVPHGDYFWSQLLPLCFAVYPAARLLDGPLGRWGWLVAVAAVEADVVHSHLARAEGGPWLPLVLFGGCTLAGRLARRSAEEAAALAATMARLAEEQAAREEAAVEEERTRIAVEVHDVVAHAVSVMVLQVGAARMGLEGQGHAVPAQLRAAEETGREALSELRRSLGILRTAGDKGLLEPLPGLADVASLVERFRVAGLHVRIDLDPDVASGRGLAVGLQLSVYRLVQEALTNVLKHAGAVPVDVCARSDGSELAVSVSSSGAVPPPPALPSGGHGLVGMRERVAMYGGRLHAGPRADGFAVEAWFPLHRADDADAVQSADPSGVLAAGAGVDA